MARYNLSHLERPSNLQEAAMVLKKWGSKARIVAGNTTVYELANQGGLDGVEVAVDLSNLELNYVAQDTDYIRIGAMTTFAEIAECNLHEGASNYSLREAAKKLTPPQIRNMATVGGSVCSGLPIYDMPVTLLAQNAEFQAFSSAGQRTIKAEEFFVDYFVTALSADEILTEIRCPVKALTGSSFVKLGRTSTDFAVVNSSVMLTLEESRKKVTEVRIALGAVASIPIRAKAGEEFLAGKEPSRENLVKTASLCADFDASPTFHASSNYKRKVIPVIVRDALFASLNRIMWL